MGYDKDRFVGQVDEELICAICHGVFRTPVQVQSGQSRCEHTFCSECIFQWLKTKRTCPIDRMPMTMRDLAHPCRLLTTLLNRLKLRCDFASAGCAEELSIETLEFHRIRCRYNPDLKSPCSKGCGEMVSFLEEATHSCIPSVLAKVDELKKIVNMQCQRIDDLEFNLTKQAWKVREMKMDLDQIEEYIRNLRFRPNPVAIPLAKTRVARFSNPR